MVVSIKKVKGVNKNVVATISHNEYIDVLLSQKYETFKIRTYEINKFSLPCFERKIYILNNIYDG